MYDSPLAPTSPIDRRVVFPCGMVSGIDSGRRVLYVSIGENDAASKIVTIDYEKLLASLRPIAAK